MNQECKENIAFNSHGCIMALFINIEVYSVTLEEYMRIRGISRKALAKELGRSRQSIEQWLQNGAVVELLDNGKIDKVKTNRTVFHQPQVKS